MEKGKTEICWYILYKDYSKNYSEGNVSTRSQLFSCMAWTINMGRFRGKLSMTKVGNLSTTKLQNITKTHGIDLVKTAQHIRDSSKKGKWMTFNSCKHIQCLGPWQCKIRICPHYWTPHFHQDSCTVSCVGITSEFWLCSYSCWCY